MRATLSARVAAGCVRARTAMSSEVSTGQKDTRDEEGFMRRLILQTGVSIDGYVAALDGSHPWGDGSEDEAVKRWILDSVWAAGAHLMGRVTYEEMAAFWPTSESVYDLRGSSTRVRRADMRRAARIASSGRARVPPTSLSIENSGDGRRRGR